MSTPQWLIRDDGKLFAYDRLLANHPRLTPYFPDEEAEEEEVLIVEETPKPLRELEYCDTHLHFANKNMIADYAKRVFGVTLDKRKGVDVLRKQARELQKEEG